MDSRSQQLDAGGGRWGDGVFLGAVLLVALVLRMLMLGEWSLWLDEETSISHAYRLDQPFARSSPAYFHPLRAVLDRVDDSVWWGRFFSVAFGVASVGLLYLGCRRYLSRTVAVGGSLLMAVCLHHLFWSQSIRYYTFLLAVELAASWLFYSGVAERRYGRMLGAAGVASFGLTVHNTGMLLLPVWVGFLGLLWITGRRSLREVSVVVGVAVVPFALAIVAIWPSLQALQASGATGPKPGFQSPLPLAVRFVFYFGIPMFLLGLLGLARVWRRGCEATLFVACLAWIPIAEAAALGMFALANVTIHHAFVAVAGMAALAGVGFEVLRSRSPIGARVAVAGCVLYYGSFLGLYFTGMHGDRPRWQEATAYLSEHVEISEELEPAVPIYSTARGILNFYLGVPPRQTAGHPLVNDVPAVEALETVDEGWFVVDPFRISPQTWRWLKTEGEHAAEYPAATGPRDRTIHVFRIHSKKNGSV